MELIVPDVLGDVQQLSAVLPLTAMLAGLVLWLAGWWTHRFWVVLLLTVAGGIAGLEYAAELHAQPLLAALGVALSAGLLALTLVRLLAFLAGGCAGLALVHTLWPGWDQPLFAFLFGALVGLFLFRFWTMALTSLAGVLLIAYGGLALAGRWTNFDPVAWCEGKQTVVNAALGLAAAGGLLVQLVADWLANRKPAPAKEAGKKDKSEKKEEKKEDKKDKQPPAGWWPPGLPMFHRAG
jgi:MFS family permease